MTFNAKYKAIFTQVFLVRGKVILVLWIVISAFLGIFHTLNGLVHNNYQIYKYVFLNTLEKFPLYQPRPEFFDDLNHYGPIFSLVMAPFAILPDVMGVTLWLIGLSILLYLAIKELPLAPWQQMVIFLIVTNSLIIAQVNVQFNTATLAMIILSYTLIRKEKDFWAACLIMLGTFIKLYGIVGFAFFFFSKHKSRLVLWSFFWAFLFFLLPMLISSPQYIIDQYIGWYNELVFKNQGNGNAVQQNISLLGMAHKITGNFAFSDLPIILAGLALFASSYLRFRKFSQIRFQLLLLASVLIFTVLFSTGSEPNSYVIAVTGVAIWFVIQSRPYSVWTIVLITLAIVISSFSPSDLFPDALYRNWIRPYALQALPCVLVWLTITWDLLFYKTEPNLSQ